MIKTPLSTVIGGAFWTPRATILGSASKTLNQLIKSLFANNEQGFAYDPNDLSTMFQDATGTVPVTGVGQAVGLIRDKSGRGNHAFQTVSASRPILQRDTNTGAYYLAFDGVDDFLVTNSIDFTATDKVSLFAGVRKLSDVNIASLLKLSDNTLGGRFELLIPPAINSKQYEASVDNSWARFEMNSAPVTNVLSVSLDRAAATAIDEVKSRLDGKVNSSVANSGSNVIGKFGSYPLFIGRRNGTTFPFNGHLYSLIGIGRLTTDTETKALEKELAKRTGVTLNV